MNFPVVFRMLGMVLCCNGFFLALSLGVSILSDGHDWVAFCLAILFCFGLGLPLARIKPLRSQFYARDGFMIVALSWVCMSFAGALPYYIGGTIPAFVDCFFESASGFTTTGATILTEIESLPRGILFWRSLSHWLGGMGVLVLTLALIPSTGGSALFLMQAESTGPAPGKIVPTMRQTAKTLYTVYLIISAVLLALLLLCGMPLYDSFIHMFGTMGTGGFSNMNLSVGAYNNLPAEVVISVFMLICSLNFGLYPSFIFGGSLKALLRSTETRAFLGVVALCMAAMTFNIMPLFGGSFGTALRHASFQAASIVSTSGFATTNFDLWPTFSKGILVFLMFMGASAGSTGGGVKVVRLVVAFKALRREINRIIRPRQVSAIVMDGQPVPEGIVSGIALFLLAYIALLAAATMALLFIDGQDLVTTFTAVLSCIGNIGPGLGTVGPMGSFSGFAPLSKWILSFCMLAGRLELYPMLLLLSPSTYKKA